MTKKKKKNKKKYKKVNQEISIIQFEGTEQEKSKTERLKTVPGEQEVIVSELDSDLDEYLLETLEDEQEKKRRKFILQHHHRRVLGITIAICITLILAASAGVLLAFIENGKGIGDLMAAISNMSQNTSEASQTVFAEERASSVSVDDVDKVAQNGKTTELNHTVQQENVKTVSGTSPTEEDANNVAEENVGESDSTTVSGDETVSENEYPKEFQLVDESYFDDALFIGDSRMEGFGLHSGLNATFYAATGLQLHKIDTYKVVKTEEGKKPIFEVMQPGMFKKVYIKVGLNEMGWGTDAMFLQKYTELIAKIRELEPDAIIYIHGLIHVTAAKSASDATHNNDAINARNEMLKNFAIVQNAYYVDINEVVSDENGALYSDLAGDGIHLKASYMELWKNYLMAHAIVE